MYGVRNGEENKSAVFFDESEICLFELTDSGTILYCRNNQHFDNNSPELIGRNLFDEAPPFENMEEFRHKINRFVKSEDLIQEFNFDCQTRNRIIPIKIKLIRTDSQKFGKGSKTIIADFRKI